MLKNHIVNFSQFERIFEDLENGAEPIDFEMVDREDSVSPEETETDSEESEEEYAEEMPPTREITDPGYSRENKNVMQIAGDLETASMSDDEELARKALTNWFELVNSVSGHVASLNIERPVLSKIINAVQAIPNHKELIASIRGEYVRPEFRENERFGNRR
jgi:hypothetical protein